jgi:hypothetical protein
MMKSALIALVATTVGCKQAATPATAGSDSPATPGTAAAAPAPAAPKPASAPAAPAAPAPSGKPLREALADAAARKPLVLALDAKGQLVARSVDGSSTSVVLSGPYGDALHDGALDLVWLRRDTGLDVLDLRLPGPAVAKQLATAPDKALEKLGEHFREPPHWDMTTGVVVYLGDTCHQATGMTLDWTKGGVGTTGAEDVKIVAKDWFAAQEHRTRREVPPAFTRKLAKRHKVPKDLGTCHADAKEELGKTECGRGLYFGATNYELVVVSANPEKCPAKQCRLHDEATKKYTAVPGIAADDAEAASCGPFLFDGTGTMYLVDDQVCADQKCTSVGRQAIGWLDGSRVLDGN